MNKLLNMNKIIITFFLIQLSFFAKAQYQVSPNVKGPGFYTNPIFAGGYPDPSILRDGDNYYMVPSIFMWSYSKYPEVRLYLNDKLIGEKATGLEQEFRASFPVPFMPGILRATGLENGKETAPVILQNSGQLDFLKVDDTDKKE
jgi:hypothetical protein